MESLKNLLPKSLAKTKAQKQLHASVVISVARKIAVAEFGEEASDRLHFVSLRDRVLKISCDDAATAQDVRLRADRLITAINEKMANEEIFKLLVTC